MTILRNRARTLARLAVLLAGVALLAGYGGRWSGALDAASHFRAHLGVVLVVLAVATLALRHWASGALALLLALLAFATSLPWMLPSSRPAEPPRGPTYTLLQMNLRFDAEDRALALRRIADAQPDIITVQELSEAWRQTLEVLDERYPYQFNCGSWGEGGSAIYSRRPFVVGDEGICGKWDGMAARRVDFNGTPVRVVSLHLDWPWPRMQRMQVRRINKSLAPTGEAMLMAGDFNAVPWSATVGDLAAGLDLTRVAGIGPTWMLFAFDALPTRPFGLPIDNILVSKGFAVSSVETLERTASDHLPVLMRFSVPAPEPGRAVAEHLNAN